MSTIKAKNIKQTVISGTTQPLKIGGILEDGSDAKITIDTSGNTTLSQVIGIKFPATQVPSSDANTLDDYEEGTFTPYIYGDVTAGVGTYSIQYGKYTKVGNLVSIVLSINWTNHTGSGAAKIGGLPFINSYYDIPVAYVSNGTGHVSDGAKYAVIQASASHVYMGIYSTTTGYWISGRVLTTGGDVYISATYLVA